MAQHPIEMILLRQWASTMAIPIWMCDGDGNLIYYNEPAEEVLGIRFDEAGEIPASEVADRFVTTDLDGSPLATEQLPLVIALTRAEPAHRPLRFKAGDGSWRMVEVTALPVTGHADRILGAVTMFWEPPL
jgi:PAS domain S-box-containing protein